MEELGSEFARPHTVLDVLRMAWPNLTLGAYALVVNRDGTISIFQPATATAKAEFLRTVCLSATMWPLIPTSEPLKP